MPNLQAGAEPALSSQPGLPRPAPPVSAGSALSGCDIHPDEEGAPPGQGARRSRPLPPRSRPPCPGRAPPARAGAPRPSRRTCPPGPLRSSGGRVPAPPGIHRRRRSLVPPPAGHGCQEGAEPPRPPQQLLQLSPLRPPAPAAPRSAPRALPAVPPPHPARRCSALPPARLGAAGSAPSGAARCNAVRYGTVRCGAVRCSAVWYGAAPCHRPQPAAPRRANPGPSLSLRPADSPGSQWETPAGRRVPPQPVAPAHAERPGPRRPRGARPRLRAGVSRCGTAHIRAPPVPVWHRARPRTPLSRCARPGVAPRTPSCPGVPAYRRPSPCASANPASRTVRHDPACHRVSQWDTTRGPMVGCAHPRSPACTPPCVACPCSAVYTFLCDHGHVCPCMSMESLACCALCPRAQAAPAPHRCLGTMRMRRQKLPCPGTPATPSELLALALGSRAPMLQTHLSRGEGVSHPKHITATGTKVSQATRDLTQLCHQPHQGWEMPLQP